MVTIINFLIVIIFIVSIFFMCCFGMKSFMKSIVETWKKLCCDGEKNNDEIKLFASRCSLCQRKFVYTSNSDIKMHKISKEGSTVTLCNDCYEKIFHNNYCEKDIVVDESLRSIFGKIKSD